MEFCLKRNTVCINIIDQPNSVEVKKVVFFGDIPDKLRKIINARTFDKHQEELKSYFGKRWKEKLHIVYNTKSIKASLMEREEMKTKFIGKTVHQGKSQTASSMARVGGFEFDLENETEVKLEDKSEIEKMDYSQKVLYVTDIILFPEDTFWTLKEKIFLATGIPVYRQYVYKRVKSSDPTLQLSAHSILISESPYMIDTKNDTELFNGIHIDKNMYNNRENLRIKTKEPYKMIDSMLTDDIYLIDLDFYRRAITNIESILGSSYSSDVLYFGLFKKYYPIFSKDMMINYFTNEVDVYNSYPLINTPRSKLEVKYDTEKEILLRVYNDIDSYYNKFADDIELSISEINYKLLDSYSIQNGLFIRNLVDLFPCDADHPFIECYNTKNNAKYRIIRSFKNQDEALIEAVLNARIYKVVDEVSVYFWDRKFKQLNKFSINANAVYSVTAKYLRSDNVDFSDSLENMSPYINKFIDIINKNKRLVFNPNFTMNNIPIFDKTTTVVSNVRVNVKWNSIVTQQQFAYVNEVMRKFYTAGIAEPRILSTATPNIVNVRIKKGINQRVNKFFLKKRVEVKDYYIIYHDVKSSDIWNNRYGGKHINIENNLTDITFEFINIADREFVRVINYMLCVIDEVSTKSTAIKKDTIIKDIDQTSKKGAMKKMKSLDPKLYNFSVSGTNKAVKYSRICQKKFRPVNIYTKEEFDLMPKERKDKLHQFINYTTGDPVWYECPKSLPYFGFITGKHPAGYCLPKCKLSETEGAKNKAVKEACTSKFSFDNKVTSSGMLKFGKTLAIGKVGFLHEKIYEMVNMLTGNNDIHLFIKSVNPNYAGVLGSKIICCFAEQLGVSEQTVLNDCLTYAVKHKMDHVVGVITEMLSGESKVIDDMTNVFTELLQQVYDVHIIYINTVISTQNEILNSQNSTVYFNMSQSCSAYLSKSKNIRVVIIQRLYGNMYPVLYAENKLNKTSNELFASKISADKQNKEVEFIVGNYIGVFDSESIVVDLLHKAMIKKIINIDKELQNKGFIYNALKEKMTNYTKYISGGKIKYLVTKGKSALCIGVSDSVNIVENGIEECHDVFTRKDYDLPFSKLAEFLSHFRLPPVAIIVLKNDIYNFDKILDDDTAIGLKINNITCWFNDTKVSKVKSQYPEADAMAILFDPSEVNNAIAKRHKPKHTYMKDIESTYYDMYIYMLLKYEVYKYILQTRNLVLRRRLLESAGNKEFIDEMNSLKQTNRDDYHKIMNVFNNSSNIEVNLNRILLSLDVEYVIDIWSRLSSDEVRKKVEDILNKIVKLVDSPSGKINNVIVSYIEYKNNKVENIKHEEDVFYVNNNIKVLKDRYKDYVDNITNDIKNKLLFTYEMNNFNIFFVINYFHFTPIPGTTVHIQFL